ncbi:TPR domain protein [Talaromyces stipitatus ATCC 10500]|uniref:TPR domain protein n=1 Tax=Talaromyces stipitatus (strain ATCC 10500 / CBS 375.48 / QM 6759 / NRRL 1006) TaxID=441959 RepID=B8MBK4_TALSN|nr:TPR domain protein [Talaromyces stipitatus ATCC 10500]EED17868.1 TPR domain protein [Talaromyces stipitatus ATCC 10500]
MFSCASRRFVALRLPSTEASHVPRRSLYKDLPITYTSTQIRTAAFSQRIRRTYRSAARDIWRKNPVFFPFAIVSIIAATAVSTYLLRRFYLSATEVDEKVNRFPPAVAKELRKALYSTEINLEPQKALEHYRAALRVATELGMHPWSDEVLGIKLQMADMLVKAGYHKQAVQMLTTVMKDAFKWAADTRTRYSVTLPKDKPVADPNLRDLLVPEEETKEYELRQTDKTMKKVIGTHLLIAELQEGEHLKDPAKSFLARRQALEILRQEIRYREARGLPALATPEEGDGWLNAEEVGHIMSDLGETWLRAGRPDKALELLMPSIAILRDVEGKEITCRQVVLLANIAAAMFDHKPDQQDATNKKRPPVTVEQQMQSSRAWALKAIEVSKMVQEDMRDEDCDLGCAAAADVLSAIADWRGADEEARKWLREEKRYCESANYAEGVEKAVTLLASYDRARKKTAKVQ